MKHSLTHPASILVFETNIRFKKDVDRVKALITSDYRIKKWNVDRQDRSKVLRVEATDLAPAEVIELITKAGYQCQELPD